MGPGENQTVTLDGLTVEVPGEAEVRVDDANAIGTVTIRQPAMFEVSIQAPDNAGTAEPVDLTVTVTNTGVLSGEYESSLSKRMDNGREVVDEFSADLDAGASTQITFEDVETSRDDIAEFHVDGTDATATTVLNRPANFEYGVEAPQRPRLG